MTDPIPRYEDPRLDPIRAAVRSLPSYPFELDDDSVQSMYLDEFEAVDGPDSLRVFTTRWAPLWTINFREPGNLLPEELSLSSGQYNETEVYAALVELNKEKADSGPNPELTEKLTNSVPYRTALYVKLPPALLHVFFVAEKYKAPFNMVWNQASGLTELF